MSRRLAFLALCITALCVLASCGRQAAGSYVGVDASGIAAAARVPGADWTRFDFNAQRTGAGPARTGIVAGNLGLLRRRVVPIDGTVDSSPVELHGVRVGGRGRDVVVVTTTYGKTIALDARTGKRLWEFTPARLRSYVRSYQVTTATPVVDPDRRYVYAASPDGLINKLAVANGRPVRTGHWPARITFDATREKIAAALNISGNVVVAVTGGYIGDAPSYQGHVALIDRASGRVTRVWNALCSNRHFLINPPRSCPASDAAIWARSGAVIEPGSGRILVATGNAPFNGVTDWGDSVLELAADAGRLLHNWTPSDQQQLSQGDTDLGSTAPALLPRAGGLRLAVQGGKDRQLHLLNLDRLNGTTSGAGRRLDGELQDISAPGGDQVFTAPAVWRKYVFVADNSATAGYVLDSGHRLRRVWEDGTPGTSPVVAGGLLYVFDPFGGRLVVRNPASGRQLASLPAAGGHWNSPIVAGGRIVLAVGNYMDHATSGVIYIYHLPGR